MGWITTHFPNSCNRYSCITCSPKTKEGFDFLEIQSSHKYFNYQVATYTFLEQLTGQSAVSEKEKALACQVGACFAGQLPNVGWGT